MRLSKVDRDGWTVDELVEALYNVASGDYRATAAVMLIDDHDTWLRRAEFLDCVDVDFEDDDDVMRVSVNWERVGKIFGPASPSEIAIVHIAASIASEAVRVSIGDLISHLDTVNTRRVLTALAHAAGRSYLFGGAR